MSDHAIKLIKGLVRVTEERPDRVRDASKRIDESKIPALDLNEFHQTLRHAENTGAIQLIWGKKDKSHILETVKLLELDKACVFLGITSSVQLTALAFDCIDETLQIKANWIADVLKETKEQWLKRKRAFDVEVTEPEKLVNSIIATQSLLDGKHTGLDMRTFSRRVLRDSKAVEKLKGPIIKLCRKVFDFDGLDAQQVFEAIGLQKFPQPILVSGSLKISQTGTCLNEIAPYIGLPPSEEISVTIKDQPRYVLTIENLASFNLYVRQIKDNGLVIYTGGYPSTAVAGFISHISSQLDDNVPWYHWGDIDMAGLMILKKVEAAAGRGVVPHLMTVELAQERGEKAKTKPNIQQLLDCSGEIGVLARFLNGNSAYTLEQEELEPKSPL